WPGGEANGDLHRSEVNIREGWLPVPPAHERGRAVTASSGTITFAKIGYLGGRLVGGAESDSPSESGRRADMPDRPLRARSRHALDCRTFPTARSCDDAALTDCADANSAEDSSRSVLTNSSNLFLPTTAAHSVSSCRTAARCVSTTRQPRS